MLDGVRQRLGFVPNVHKLLGMSPQALTGFLGLQHEMSKTLDVKTRDAIALAVSEADGCDYCLAAHSYLAANYAKLTPEEIADARKGSSTDPKRNAAVRLAKALVESRGKVEDSDVVYCRTCGYNDREIIEMITLTVQYLLTNFINNAAETPIDFPGYESHMRAE
ncbi:MAG: alkylhydroperoxidase [Bradyrhizobium sp.]|nr:alkylhydroperoxidase [Bradyrhizobium sp.]